MRNLLIRIILIILLTSCSPTDRNGWFKTKDEPYQQKLAQVEDQLVVQRKKTDSWAGAAAALAIACVLLLIIGTALGTKTRHATRTRS